MSLKEQLASGKFVLIAELQPPKGNQVSELMEHAEHLRSRVDAFSVPDLQNAIMRLGSLSVCTLLKGKGIEPIFSLSCRHRNRLALQSDLLNASALGLENILILQGDDPSLGDHYEAKSVLDLDLLGLLEATKRLLEGQDLAGHELSGKPTFTLGTHIKGGTLGYGLDLDEVEKMVRLGVNFFFTDSIFDPALFKAFAEKVSPFKVPIIAGITLLKSVGMARYISKHIKGISIPEAIMDRLMKASDKQRTSAEIAGDLIKSIRPFCQGIHLIPIGWESQIPVVLDHAGL
jgi:methylenetetrahydrofolate reductase (NADPH)